VSFLSDFAMLKCSSNRKCLGPRIKSHRERPMEKDFNKASFSDIKQHGFKRFCSKVVLYPAQDVSEAD